METDLSIRLHAYATTAEAIPPGNPSLYSDALASSRAASAAVSAGIICSHTRVLRGHSPPVSLLPGQDELDLLAADSESTAPGVLLPLRSGHDTLDNLVLGAAGIPAIKSRNG